MSTVPEHLRPWHVPYPDYDPVDITPTELRADGTLAESVRQGWAEPITDPTTIDWAERQAHALIPYNVVDGLPLNPTGRTGRTGRNLGRWGENQAADPIVIAGHHLPNVLLIRREDCGHWAIPGGMVDPGETAPTALVRELREETGVDLSTVRPEIIARTYVDDPRASDHAWVTTTAAIFRLTQTVTAQAADDAIDAAWWPAYSYAALQSAITESGGVLYKAHAPLLTAALPAGRGRTRAL